MIIVHRFIGDGLILNEQEQAPNGQISSQGNKNYDRAPR
jgi:hypothetical protein